MRLVLYTTAERGVFDSEQVDELARMKQDVSDAELLFGSW